MGDARCLRKGTGRQPERSESVQWPRLATAERLFFSARLQEQSDVAQRFLDLDKIGLECHGEFVESSEQFVILRYRVADRSRAVLNLLACGFVRHEKQLLFSQKPDKHARRILKEVNNWLIWLGIYSQTIVRQKMVFSRQRNVADDP